VVRAHYVWLAFIAVGLLLHEYAYKDFLVDDAFISFRYAENLVAGYGLTFNRVGEPVEGYTNFLWTLLLAGVLYFKLDPILTAKVLGSLLSLFNLGLTYGISRKALAPAISSPWTLLPLLFLAVSGSFAAWAMGGLETHLVTLLNLLALELYLQELGSERAGFPFSAIFFTLAALTRPDAILFWGAALVMGLSQGADRKKRGGGTEARKIRRTGLVSPPLSLWAWALIPLIGFGAFWVWRWNYYGDPLPNTYYMKTGGGGFQILAGVFYVLNYLLSQGGLFPFLLFYFFRWKYDTYLHRLLLAQVGFYLVFIIASGGDWMPLHRFMVPLLPLLAILIAAALKGLHEKLTLFLKKMDSRFRPSTLPLLTGFLLVFPLFETLSEHPIVMEESRGVWSFVEFGKWLANRVPASSLLAVNPVGAISYYSHLDALDMTGLTDSHIAHLRMGGLHQKYDSAYILSHRPDFIVLIGRYDPETQGYRATWAGEEDLFHKPEFQSRYRPTGQPVFKYKKDYQILLFQRRS